MFYNNHVSFNTGTNFLMIKEEYSSSYRLNLYLMETTSVFKSK